ncbi:MAG: helix-turn-helix domain-containing protein [Christensenellales bacterium]
MHDNQYPSDSFIELLPLSVIEAARAGDAEAVERVLRYYSSYMNKLCTRTLYDENGYPHVCLDEATKRRLEIKLIHAIVTTK